MKTYKKKSNSLQDEVLALGLDLADGETKNGLVCPACRGGNSGDRAFSLTRRGSELLGICFRAKCGFTTRMTSNGSTAVKVKPRTQKLPEFRVSVPEWFYTTFPYLGTSYYRKLRTYNDRLCTPILDSYGEVVGYSCRSYDPTVRPKTLTYWSVDVPVKADFAEVTQDNNDVVLVEDQISARMVSRYCDIDTVALLGSHVSQQLVEYLWNDLKFRRILIALDEDATKKAIKFAQRYSLYNVEAMPLTKDPKDMTPDEVISVFSERLYGLP